MNTAGVDPREILNEAVLATVRAHGLRGEVFDLPEGDEVEVFCAPLVPVEGARFFLRVELADLSAKPHPRVPVSSRLMASWRTVPEPVAVVGLDPKDGKGRLGEVHGYLALLDRNRPGWERHETISFPLTLPLDGGALPALARRAADLHVIYDDIVGRLRTPPPPPPRGDEAAVRARLRESDLAHGLSCVDLLREAGILEENAQRELVPTAACHRSFARAAVVRGLGSRAHPDPAVAAEAARAAVVRILLARLPHIAPTTLERCALVMSHLLPLENAEAVLDYVREASAENARLAEEG